MNLDYANHFTYDCYSHTFFYLNTDYYYNYDLICGGFLDSFESGTSEHANAESLPKVVTKSVVDRSSVFMSFNAGSSNVNANEGDGFLFSWRLV